MTIVEVPARTARAVDLAANQTVTVVDVGGGQVADVWAFVAGSEGEHASAEHTRAALGKLFPEVGEAFVTNRRRPLLCLESDSSPGSHDMLIAACNPERYAQLGAQGWHASCEENLLTALAEQGRPEARVPSPINLFMNTPFLPDGNVRWLPTQTSPGDAVCLRALLDCVVVVSACPQDLIGINRRPGPLHLVVGPRSGTAV